jgi:benzoate membrane transport protein
MRKKSLSISHLVSGFVAVLVGFTSSVLIIFQAAQNAGANPQEMASWIFALGASIAVSAIAFSWHYKMPILTGWSTPGAALLVTSLHGVNMSQAVASFMFGAFLTFLVGITGVFDRLTRSIPKSITAAMLAGILMRFGMDVFVSFQTDMELVGLMILTYVLGKRFFPRFVILMVLLVGMIDAYSRGLLHLPNMSWHLTTPVWTMPDFHWATLISVGVPLFVVTMTSQNITGLSVMTSSGYEPPTSPIISWIGFLNFIFAPFGCFAIGLAAITAAICSGKESDPNPKYRYKSVLVAGVFWTIIAMFGATVVALFTMFPKALVTTIAGLALFNTIGSSLSSALYHEEDREAAIITFLITASGVSLMGIGSAFWGLFAGIISLVLLNWQKVEEQAVQN